MRLGPFNIEYPVLLAPMAGVTDLPFRILARQFGAPLVVSEMLTEHTHLWNSRKSRKRLDFTGEPGPIAVQIAGSDPRQMAEAARQATALGAEIVDINMGCPAKKVLKKAAGSALLENEPLVAQILCAVVEAVPVPVTLKIRTGPCPERRNGVRIAQLAEQAGVQMLTVHGRTRACRFVGEVEYGTIAEIVRRVDIPVIANGDIDSPATAARVLEQTGASGVMVGRGAFGRPWLPGAIAEFLRSGRMRPEPAGTALTEIVAGHLRALHRFYGEPQGVRIARKHIGWYFGAATGDFTRRFNALEDAQEQLDFVHTRVAQAA